METENWKPIHGFEGVYEISDLGRVKSLPRRIVRGKTFTDAPERVLNLCIDGKGYLFARLYQKCNLKRLKVHRLVGLNFVENPNPAKFDQLNHLDGDKLNCRADNLEWTDNAGNQLHAYANGLNHTPGKSGEEHPLSKLTAKDVEEIRRLRGQKSCREIGLLFNVSKSHINAIQNGKKW